MESDLDPKSGFQILVADFDLAHDFRFDEDSRIESYPGGTPEYQSPEAAACHPKGRASDIFSLGCVFAEMITVHWHRTLDDFEAFRERKISRPYHSNLGKVYQWLNEIMAYETNHEEHLFWKHLPSAFKADYWRHGREATVIQMLDADPVRRPTAQMLIDSKVFSTLGQLYEVDCICKKLPLVREI